MSLRSDRFLSADDIPLEDLGGGISRKILAYDESIMMVRAWFETGAIGYLHSHPHSQVTFVESGEFEFAVGDEKRVLTAGDSVYAEPNVTHGAVCKSKGVLLDVFSPIREDFLPEEQGA